jgi:hypothetical protein
MTASGKPVRRGFSARSLASLEYWFPAFAGTTTEYDFAISRHVCPRFAREVPALQSRAQGRPGARRTRGLVCNADRKCAHEHTGSAEASRPSLRNGFTAYFVLSPENGSFASVARETLSPLVDLTPAPRRQNHTTSPYASATLVSYGICVHRISPRVSDDGQRPSSRGETATVMPLIWVRTKAAYFCAKGSTDFADLPVVPVCRSARSEIAMQGKPNHPAARTRVARICAR